MNGEVNGTMEEPMDTSTPPASPMGNLTTKKAAANPNTTEVIDNHHENSNNTDNSTNHLDSEQCQEQEPIENSKLEPSTNENSNDSGAQEPHNDTNIPTISVPNNANSNNLTIENHYSNSNESYPDSMDSSKTKKSEQTDGGMSVLTQEYMSKIENTVDFERCRRTIIANDEDSDDEVDSEEDSTEEEGSEGSNEPRAEDTVSINSDSEEADDNSQDSRLKHKNSEIVILQNDNALEERNGTDTRGSHSPEVHEIMSDNDDCIMTNDEKTNSSDNQKGEPLRRSNRAIKRKKYDDDAENGDDESDIEEVTMEDPLNQFHGKNKPIVVNDTKTLVEMASKQMKSNQGNNQKKEPTVVIIDTNSILSGKGPLPMQHTKNSISTAAALCAQTLYQSIAARGTTVTPVSSKSLSNTQSSAVQPLILPSLTDDMFVVEAPSFIVPYVYEKPSIKPFREFVDVLGKELEEQRAKEEQEKLEKEKEQKEKEKQDKKEQGEEIEEMEVDTDKESKVTDEVEDEATLKKKKSGKKERRRRRNEDDDASWDGLSTSDSDDDIISDEDEKTVVLKEKEDSIEEIKGTINELSTDKISTGKPDNYFDCSLGKFFINIGLNLVQEYVQNDLLKQQNRKLYKEKKTGSNTRGTESAIASLMKNLEFSKENNAPYVFKQKKCEFCSFKTESMLAMTHHLETPHMKNNVYKCNFCAFEIRSPHDILYHMEAEHNIRGRLERAPAYHQCANCPFEDNGKGKLARHLIPCAKKFKPELNLAPPIEWEPPAKIPKIARARNHMMNSYQSAFTRAQVGNSVGRPPINVANMMPGVVNNYRARGRSPLGVPPRAAPVHGTPLIRSGVMVRHNAPNPVLMASNYPMMQNTQTGKNVGSTPKLLHHQPSISITPLPRPPQPSQPQPSQQSKGTFVICEICDGYIKDLEQLRNHMQWIHKVKIHPKMIYNRPPLNCQKCQFRFFTDQGLERHLLGSHGLVTSSMQEAANKGKDAGRCPVCGRVYQWKLLNHVAKDHSLTLKPAHLSYKCTVCTATFGMYKQFENHVYSAHSVVAKRVMDKTKTTTPATKVATNDSLLKPLKINDEITIIPQPAKPSTPTSTKGK